MKSSASFAPDRHASISGVLAAAGAFLIWGLSPVYWKALAAVPPVEIVSHRIVWSFVFLVALIFPFRQWSELAKALKRPRTLAILCVTAALVAVNWLLYIWAVNNNYLLQASLGYYINPLVNVVLGMLILRERLRLPQAAAVLVAAGAVLYLTISYGRFPWIALALALSFGFYGLIRKVAPVSALVGLTVETLLLSLPAGVYLIHGYLHQTGFIFRAATHLNLLLMGTSLLTAVPLLLFTIGARRIHLSTLGLMQYIAPSGMFLLAVLYYGEPFARTQLWTFVFIWSALAIYSTDALWTYRRAESARHEP